LRDQPQYCATLRGFQPGSANDLARKVSHLFRIELFLWNYAGEWFGLLRENRFAIAPECLLRAGSITFLSAPNGVLRWPENARYRKEWERIEILPPLFVLGHYRCGTTHLHNLLAVDNRFAYPNAYQALFPIHF